MKTSYLSIHLIFTFILAFLFSFATLAQTANVVDTVKVTNEPRPLNVTTSEMMPYDYPNFEMWAKGQNDEVIWLYLYNENYREMVNDWNLLNNPFWAGAITGSCPFGTFDFSMGLSKADLVQNHGPLQEHLRFVYKLNPIKRTNLLGQPYFASKIASSPKSDNIVDIKNLPTKNPKSFTANQHIIAPQIDFTQHITPVVTYWSQNKGMNKRNKLISTGIQTYISATPSNNANGTNRPTMISKGNTSTISASYNNYGKGGGGPSIITNSSNVNKTVSTGRTATTSTSKN